MALKNTAEHWGGASRWLHWGFALGIVVEVAAGFVMSRTFASKDPLAMQWHFWASNVHHTGGLLLLLTAFARLGWRLGGPVPAPASQGKAIRAAARGTHWLLYALMLAIPLTGWAALSSLADSPGYGRTILWLFGTNGFDNIVPHIVPPVPWDGESPFRYSNFARAHRWLLIGGAGLLGLHVSAALAHHFFLKDPTLRRMLGRPGIAEQPPAL